MKIKTIKPFDEDKIIVELEEYPHASPVFSKDITVEELETKLKEWKVNQDSVDLLNKNREIPTEKEIPKEIKDLINKEI